MSALDDYIVRLEVAEMAPDDVLIVTIPASASKEMADDVKSHVVAKLGLPERRVVVKPESVSFSVLRETEEP